MLELIAIADGGYRESVRTQSWLDPGQELLDLKRRGLEMVSATGARRRLRPAVRKSAPPSRRRPRATRLGSKTI